jgi:uncharacterized protein YgbK (DUF1537 family)
MIAVIADDFTGAAELAGISLRYELKVELCVDEVEYKNADVLIVSTDSRSLNKEQAIAVTEKTVRQILQLNPQWIYKKIDSVLRGYVIDEANVQMRVMNKTKAFIMPANPSLGRTIKGGEYFVNGIKLNQTSFEHDPEFPITSSLVKEILNNEVIVAKTEDEVSNGIIVGELEAVGDYESWVDKVDNETTLIGAGDFYTALLNNSYELRSQHGFQFQSPHLYVCGTAFKERKEQLKKLNCVSYLPGVINEQWLQKTGDIIKKDQKVIIAIDELSVSAAELRATMTKAVKEIVQRESIKEIFIEGGSTASAVLQELGIKKLEPINELERGAVRMKAGDLFITVKPGSYELPQQIKELYSLK